MSSADSDQNQMNLEEFRKAFTNPPIERRSFVTYLDVDKTVFEENAKSLLQKIQDERGYGKISVRKYWEFSIEERAGGVLVPKGKVTNILRMEREGNSERPNAVIELVPPRGDRPAEFMVGHHRKDESPTIFDDLRRELEAVIPETMNAFGLKDLQGIMLRYKNKIARNRYPNLWSQPDQVILSDLFEIFGSGSGKHTYKVPFRVEFAEQAPKVDDISQMDPNASVEYRASAEATEKKEFAFLVVLTYSTLQSKVKYSLEDFWPALDWAHLMVLQSFKDSFAQKALLEFQT
jgi:hypothetical protein